MEWLASPIDPTRPHDVSLFVSWHARLMVLAWAFLFPTGILAARYFKILPWQKWPQQLDSRVWWRTHLTCQYVGGVAVFAGLIFVIMAPDALGGDLWHAIMGWSAIAVCGLQFTSGWLRGTKGGPTHLGRDGSLSGDHYDMSLRRIAFEYYHKTVGYLGLSCAWAAILFGLWQANAPIWMWVS
ncbi:MAG: cytochrome b561 domain-containing protein, partial [Pseudomonadota bacterium]